jgi:hypothetical protein
MRGAIELSTGTVVELVELVLQIPLGDIALRVHQLDRWSPAVWL